MSAKNATQESTTASGKKSEGFTDAERSAMKERAQEVKAEARRSTRAQKADGESDVLAKIAEMQGGFAVKPARSSRKPAGVSDNNQEIEVSTETTAPP